MELNKVVSIGSVLVGDGHPTAFMAELGTFYNQDVDLAIDFIDRSLEAGCPIIKTEILHDPNVCYSDANVNTVYNHATGQTKENYRKLIERKVVSLNNYERIIKYTKEKKVPLVASIYDFEGLDFFVRSGGSAIKLWRNNYNNFPLIKAASETGLPIIFDAAFIYLDEILKAVRYAYTCGARSVIINHHPGKNPAKPEEHNLRTLQTYKNILNIPVGLSCHYRGDEILYVAVGAGVNLIEKGVYSNPDQNDQNVVSTASFNELSEIVKKVSNCWKALGKSFPDVVEPRDTVLHYGLVSKGELKKGDKLSLENVRFAFPAVGIPVEQWANVVGKTISCDLGTNKAISWSDVQF